MARLGGLFHVFRTISNAFKKKRRFDNELHEFRRRLPSPVKNSTAQNWHKAAQKSVVSSRLDPLCHDSRRRQKTDEDATG
jgi:hypothetical protein